MVERRLTPHLHAVATRYPVVTVTGPRQSGKTTLCRRAFPSLPYINLEALDTRRYAQEDPRGLLAAYPDGAVIDEVQHVPELLSYVQVIVDEQRQPGRYVLTGSQHLGVRRAVGQSLAGRTAMVELLPLDLGELRRFATAPTDLWTTVLTGSYPAIYDRGHPPTEWLGDYVRTYVERDVQHVLAVTDLIAFGSFLRLCAGRVAGVLNLSSLGADAGVSHNTARAWLSVLEAGYLAYRLPPMHTNVRKRLIKAPKLHFIDSGLVCHLLGIRTAADLRLHPLRGAIFECWVVSEVRKRLAHDARAASLAFYRDRNGLEVDLVVADGRRLTAVECKSGATVGADFLRELQRFAAVIEADELAELQQSLLIYGGETAQQRATAQVLPWSALADASWP